MANKRWLMRDKVTGRYRGWRGGSDHWVDDAADAYIYSDLCKEKHNPASPQSEWVAYEDAVKPAYRGQTDAKMELGDHLIVETPDGWKLIVETDKESRTCTVKEKGPLGNERTISHWYVPKEPEKAKATLEEQINAIGEQLAQTITTYGSRLDVVDRHHKEIYEAIHNLEDAVGKFKNLGASSLVEGHERLASQILGLTNKVEQLETNDSTHRASASKLCKEMATISFVDGVVDKLSDQLVEVKHNADVLKGRIDVSIDLRDQMFRGMQDRMTRMQSDYESKIRVVADMVNELRGRKPAKRPAKKGAKR